MDDGRSCRIPVVKDADAWEWKINGVSEYECFGMLPYARIKKGIKKMRKLCADFHTHTTYCDGKSTPRQMVEAAYSMGLTDFGISGHADYSMWEPGFGMSDAILSAYKQELEILREEYAGKMNITSELNWIRWGRCNRQSMPSALPTAY